MLTDNTELDRLKRTMLRPSISALGISYLISLVEDAVNTKIMDSTTETLTKQLLLTLRKEAIKVDCGHSSVRVKSSSSSSSRAVSAVSIESLGGVVRGNPANSNSSNPAILTDSEKFASMSAEDKAASIQAVEDELMASLAGLSLEQYLSSK